MDKKKLASSRLYQRTHRARINEYSRNYYAANRDSVLAYVREHRDEYAARQKLWKAANAAYVKRYSKKYYDEHRDKIRRTSKLFYRKNKEKILKYFKTRYWNNHAEMIIYMRKHRRMARARNPEKYRAYSYKYYYAHQAKLLRRRRELYHSKKTREVKTK